MCIDPVSATLAFSDTPFRLTVSRVNPENTEALLDDAYEPSPATDVQCLQPDVTTQKGQGP